MVGNGILAFAVIFVVVIFVYMSMRLQREKQEERHFIETYTIHLTKGFTGDSLSLFINDSLIINKRIALRNRSRPICGAKCADDRR